MGHEINIDSIMVLDKRIEEITAELAQLKRSRNSLLNVARIPPDILGHIFHLNVMPEPGDGYFPKLQKGSYNFILVCHRWFRVARNTPALWSFWGNELKDWKRRHLLSGVSAPVDLVLDVFTHGGESLDEILRNVLRDRAARDVIRKVHIRCQSIEESTATAIISLLTPEDEGIRHSSMESIALSGVDVSDFFARHCFPKLRDLYLFGNFKVSCWDHLKSATAALTDLCIDQNTIRPTVVPTTSQILSLLASNPNIRFLALRRLIVSDDSGNDSKFLVPLRRLERLCLIGTFHDIFPILHRLELPKRIESASLEFYNCKFEEAYEIIGPYIRNYLQRDPRFRNRLEISTLYSSYSTSISTIAVAAEYWGPNLPPQVDSPCAAFKIGLSRRVPSNLRRKLNIKILALLPLESIVSFKTNLRATEEVLVVVPNLEVLHLVGPGVSNGFLLPDPDGPNAHKKLLPHLRWLKLEDPKALDGDWNPLITYLTHQTSDGQTVSLDVFDEIHICPEMVEQIDDLVEEFNLAPDPEGRCHNLDGSCV